MICPDNYSAFERYSDQQETWLAKRPICSDCGNHIQEDSCYQINGEYICNDCMDNYKVWTEDVIA